MNPTRILPDLQCSLPVQDIRQEVNGNLILIGVLNGIVVPQLPITLARLLFFSRWTAGVGRFKETTRIVAPDQVTTIAKLDANFELPDVTAHSMNVTALGNITFNAAGVYFVEVLVDDVMKIRYPMHVVVVPPPQTPPQKQPPPPSTTS